MEQGKFAPSPKSVRVGNECDGLKLIGLDDQGHEKTETFYNPIRKAHSASKTRIVTLKTVQVFATDEPRPEGWFGLVYAKGSQEGAHEVPPDPKDPDSPKEPSCDGPLCFSCEAGDGKLCAKITTQCCAEAGGVVPDRVLFRFEGRQLKSKLTGGCVVVDNSNTENNLMVGPAKLVPGGKEKSLCEKDDSALNNEWHLDAGRVVAPAVASTSALNTKTQCLAVKDGSCRPGMNVVLRDCDDATPDLIWKATVVQTKGGCPSKSPTLPGLKENEPDGAKQEVCELDWFEKTGFAGKVATYKNGRYYRRIKVYTPPTKLEMAKMGVTQVVSDHMNKVASGFNAFGEWSGLWLQTDRLGRTTAANASMLNSTAVEETSGLVIRDGLNSPGSARPAARPSSSGAAPSSHAPEGPFALAQEDRSSYGTLLQQRLRGGEEAEVSNTARTVQKKGDTSSSNSVKNKVKEEGRKPTDTEKLQIKQGYDAMKRHTTAIGSFKLKGPDGCSVVLYSDDNLKGEACRITMQDDDRAWGDTLKDQKIGCEDVGVCCPITTVSSLEIKYRKPPK
jgi:hypothetical protein